MKRILSIFSVSVLILLIPLTRINAQETKTEKKIKIIIDDGSGEKVITDTIVYDNSDFETIKVDDGKIIMISAEDHKDQKKSQEGSKNVTVTVTSDDETGTAEHSSVKVWTEKGDATDGEKVIIVKKVHSDDSNSEKSYDVSVTTDEKESSVEKTRFVVAKNGMVVTVEGEDETKAKELIKVIEDYMGVKNKGKEKEVKSESKSSRKK